MDSDLDDIEVVDLGERVIEPYLYEPIRENRQENEESSEETSDDESENGDLNFGLGQNGPDVNEWWERVDLNINLNQLVNDSSNKTYFGLYHNALYAVIECRIWYRKKKRRNIFAAIFALATTSEYCLVNFT